MQEMEKAMNRLYPVTEALLHILPMQAILLHCNLCSPHRMYMCITRAAQYLLPKIMKQERLPAVMPLPYQKMEARSLSVLTQVILQKMITTTSGIFFYGKTASRNWEGSA